jgi:amidase
MAPTVLDTAALLQAIAGYDGLDDRQLGAPREAPAYVEKLLAGRKGGIKGMKIGLLAESLELEALAPSVKQMVLNAVERLRQLGADVQIVAVPL